MILIHMVCCHLCPLRPSLQETYVSVGSASKAMQVLLVQEAANCQDGLQLLDLSVAMTIFIHSKVANQQWA